jgi:hypothetical protein
MFNSLNQNVTDTARLLNDHDVSTNAFAKKVDEERVKNGKGRNWAMGRTAVSIGVTKRRLRQKQQAVARKSVQPAEGGRAWEAVLIDLFGSQEIVLTLNELLTKLSCHLEQEQLVAVLNTGMKEGYFRKVATKKQSTDGSPCYQWTGKRYVHSSANTDDARHKRSLRALSIAESGIQAADIRGLVTPEGFRRLREFLNPETGEANTYTLLKESADRSRASSPGADHNANWGVVHVLSPVTRATLVGTIADHDDPLIIALPSREFLTEDEQSSFDKVSLPLVIKQTREVMREAEQIGKGKRIEVQIRIVRGKTSPAKYPQICKTFLSAIVFLLMLIPFSLEKPKAEWNALHVSAKQQSVLNDTPKPSEHGRIAYEDVNTQKDKIGPPISYSEHG